MPSATAKRSAASSGRSWLTLRTRPTSVAEPERRTVTWPPRTRLTHLKNVTLAQALGLRDLLRVHIGAVGRTEVFNPQLVVLTEEPSVKSGRVDVVGRGNTTTGRSPDGELVIEVKGLSLMLRGLDDAQIQLFAFRLRCRPSWPCGDLVLALVLATLR